MHGRTGGGKLERILRKTLPASRPFIIYKISFRYPGISKILKRLPCNHRSLNIWSIFLGVFGNAKPTFECCSWSTKPARKSEVKVSRVCQWKPETSSVGKKVVYFPSALNYCQQHFASTDGCRGLEENFSPWFKFFNKFFFREKSCRFPLTQKMEIAVNFRSM